MMFQNTQKGPAPNSNQAKEAQLIISLKFHHSKTISEIPLDVALKAMAKVWEACQVEPSAAKKPGESSQSNYNR